MPQESQGYMDLSHCLQRNILEPKRGNGPKHSSDKDIISRKPFLSIDLEPLLATKPYSGAYNVPFLLDSGSDISLIPDQVYRTVGDRNASTSSLSVNIATIRGDFHASLRRLRFRIVDIDSQFFESDFGIIPSATNRPVDTSKTIRDYFRIVRSWFFGKNPDATWEAVSMLRDGKAGILSVKDFSEYFEYFRGSRTFKIKRKHPDSN
jgi:hypothetical protein